MVRLWVSKPELTAQLRPSHYHEGAYSLDDAEYAQSCIADVAHIPSVAFCLVGLEGLAVQVR